MPIQHPTLADHLLWNDVSLRDYGIAEMIFAGSMFNALFAEESSNGTMHKYERQIQAPVVGFRKMEEPTSSSPGKDEEVAIELEMLDATVTADQGRADSHKRGKAAYMAKRSARYLKSAVNHSEKQLIYGKTGNDSKGFTGLVEHDLYKYRDSEKVIDAGGSGNNVQSIWIVRTAEDAVSALYNGDKPFSIGCIKETMSLAYDENDVVIGEFPAYMTKILSWLGLKVGSKHDVVRIANIDPTSANIEDFIQQGLDEFPEDHAPNYMFGSRRLRGAIRRARQSYNPAGTPASKIEEIDDIPFMISEALTSETALGDTP